MGRERVVFFFFLISILFLGGVPFAKAGGYVWLGQCNRVLEARGLFPSNFDDTKETNLCGPTCVANLIPLLVEGRHNRAEIIEYLVREIGPMEGVDPEELIEVGLDNIAFVAMIRRYFREAGFGGLGVEGVGPEFRRHKLLLDRDLLEANRNGRFVILQFDYSQPRKTWRQFGQRDFSLSGHYVVLEGGTVRVTSTGVIEAEVRDPEFEFNRVTLIPTRNPETGDPGYQVLTNASYYRDRILFAGHVIKIFRRR